MDKKPTLEEVITQKYEKYIKPVILKNKKEFNERNNNTQEIFNTTKSTVPIQKIKLIILILSALPFALIKIAPFLVSIIIPIIVLLGFALPVYVIYKMFKTCKSYYNLKDNILSDSYEEKIKQEIMPAFCNFFKDLHWQNGKEYTNSDIYTNSYVTQGGIGKITIEERFYGTHKECDFEIAKGRPAAYSNNFKKPKHNLASSYVYIKINTKKAFYSHTILFPAGYVNTPKLNKIQLNDSFINKNYNIYSNDETEAMKLITSKLIEKIINARESILQYDLSICFFEKSLIISIPVYKNDIFNIIRLDSDIDNPRIYIKLFNEVMDMIKIVDYFKDVAIQDF